MLLKPLAAALLSLSAFAPLPAAAAESGSPPALDPAQREQFCKDNPQTCETAQERHEKKKAWCAENPEKCKALRAERKERLQKLKEKCDANPEECEKRRAELRERRESRPPEPAPAP